MLHRPDAVATDDTTDLHERIFDESIAVEPNLAPHLLNPDAQEFVPLEVDEADYVSDVVTETEAAEDEQVVDEIVDDEMGKLPRMSKLSIRRTKKRMRRPTTILCF